ncbi:ABC transporter ATP-binding protein [Chloroflexota bacterium]
MKGIDLDVRRGEVFIIIGPTGAGKTTLLRIIGLLDKPVSGSMYFDGREVVDSESARLEIRRKMAVVFQKPAVFNASVFDNVAYGLKIRSGKGVSLHDKVANALEIVGLSGYEKRKARTLSGGEAQRVALARAIIIEPRLLLLDEPTANLDPVSTLNIEKLISRVIREFNTTVVMSTHDMSQGQRLADRMGVLVYGKIVQTGDPREIFNMPGSKEIAELVGVENILPGVLSSSDEGMVTIDTNGNAIEALSSFDAGENVYACIRPEDVTLALSKSSTSARNTFSCDIIRITLFGPLARVEVDCGFPLVALITKRSTEELKLQAGTRIYASFKATVVHVIRRLS